MSECGGEWQESGNSGVIILEFGENARGELVVVLCEFERVWEKFERV